MSLRKAVLAGTAAATAGIAITATTAMASPMPPSHHFAPPRPENFTIAINGLTDTGTGSATGPVRGAFSDKEVSATDGKWTFAHGSVDVGHTAVTAMPTGFTPANACTASISATGTWTLKGLTGVDRHARGSGTFTAVITEAVTENTTFKIEKIVKYIKVRVHDRRGHDVYDRDRRGHRHPRFKIIKVVRYVKVPVQTCDATKPLSVNVAVTGKGTATNPFIFLPPHKY